MGKPFKWDGVIKCSWRVKLAGDREINFKGMTVAEALSACPDGVYELLRCARWCKNKSEHFTWLAEPLMSALQASAVAEAFAKAADRVAKEGLRIGKANARERAYAAETADRNADCGYLEFKA